MRVKIKEVVRNMEDLFQIITNIILNQPVILKTLTQWICPYHIFIYQSVNNSSKICNTQIQIFQMQALSPTATPLYIQSRCLSPSQSPHWALLSLISAHPSFRQKINQFLCLFPSLISSSDLIKLGQLIYACILPDYPKEIRHKLSLQKYNSLQIQLSITYTNLTEYLLFICADLIENIDVRSAIGVLDLLKSRIVDSFIVDLAKLEGKRKIGVTAKLDLYDCEDILKQTQMPQKLHRKACELIYFQQKVSLKTDYELQPNQIILTKLKQNQEEVIPLGFIHQQFCSDYINNNFQTKQHYTLKGSKKINIKERVDYWVSTNEISGNTLRNKVINTETLFNCAIIGLAHLPEAIYPAPAKIYHLYRINQAFSRISYFQNLRENVTPTAATSKPKYFNILSEFYERDQFNIDELSLTKQKFIIRRKQQALGVQGKQTIKKEDKDNEDEARTLPERISKAKIQFLVDKRLEENVKDLSKSLRNHLQEDKNINNFLQKNLSACNSLPRDNLDPFKEDIITLSHINPLQMLIIGRAKSGKTSLAKAISAEFKIIHISIQTTIEKLFERSNFYKENPPEIDEDGNVKEGLLKLEEYIIQQIENGQRVQQQDILDLINLELKKLTTKSRGFILDLPLEYSPFWHEAIISNRLQVPKIGCRFFNRVIQIDQNEEQWTHFVNGLLMKPQDLTIHSALDRYLKIKPKGISEDEQQQEGQEEEAEIPLVQMNMIKITWQNSVLPLIDHITNQINPLHYLKIKNSYQSVQECLDSLKDILYRIPLPNKLQGDQKGLLTVGLEELNLARKWSPWGKADPIELSKQRLINGKFQFAAEYGGRVFLFDSEINLNTFIQNPRVYLSELPQLPKKTNIVIGGPRKAGKKTIAKALSQIYGLQIIDFEETLRVVLAKQKQSQSHIPSNPDKTSKRVHLSEPEFKDFTKGGLLNAKDILPIILNQLGIPLQKKPLGWGVEKNDEEGGEEGEQKKPAPKKAKKKEKNDDERPKTPPLEDLSLKQIIPLINHKGKLNEIKGYILVGFPHNEEQLAALKAFNIPVDKFILLSDNSEQNPLTTLSKRQTEFETEQVSNFMTSIGPVRETLGEENFKQITNLDLTVEQIVNKIRQFIDPFYSKCDDDALNRLLTEKQEEGDPIPLGFCGEHCPIALSNNWLIKGKEQFEAGFEGRRFKFSGESEVNSFRENPTKYLKKSNLLIPPRIMFIGVRGVGLKTQLLKLNQKYKVPILSFKETLLQQLQNEKNKRKSERYYNKGFKALQFDAQGKPIEDPELDQESPDFDKPALEIEITKKIFNGINEIFINGNFYVSEEQAVQTSFVQLLANARKLPEAVFILRSEESKLLQRNLDKKKLQEQFDKQIQKKREQLRAQREKDKQKILQQGGQYEEPQELSLEQLGVPQLEQLRARREEQLKQQRQSDNGRLDELVDSFKQWNVDVIQINCDRQTKHVSDRINSAIKPYLEERMNRWEQNSMLPIQRHRVAHFINNFIALQSRFGKANPFTLLRPALSYPLIYNDRIYYLNDEEQREKLMRNPLLLSTIQSIPSDVKVIPSVSVVGLTKTGKTTLVESLNKRLGLVVINLQNLIEEFTKQHRDLRVLEILKIVQSGKTLPNDMIVELIEKRISLSDCQKLGWVFDGFPSNREQCELLNKKGLLPNKVFSLKLTDLEIKKRVIANNMKKSKLDEYLYDYDINIVHQRLNANRKDLIEVEVYFLTKFNSLQMLDAKISKWGLFEQAKSSIQIKIKSRKEFVRSLITHEPTPVSNVGLNFNCILSNLSEYANYCPISYKIRREYVKLCLKHHKNAVLYNKKFYIFAGEKERNDFISNPESYKNRGNAFHPPEQIFEQQINNITTKTENKNYCMVELSRKKLAKGCPVFVLKYKGKYFATSTAANMKQFIKNPVLFEMVKLQDKLPVEFEKKSDLKKIAKQNDCTAFLQHHLSNILMKSLAELGYRRPKFPTLGSKQSALKFLSISLKANNPNKDPEYRRKYLQKLTKFINECSYSQEIRKQLDRKLKGEWQNHDEENLIKLCQQYNQFLGDVNSTQKNKYFTTFIR